VPDSLLIVAPLLVLAVVLVLGYAGCVTFSAGVPGSPGTPILVFSARVPAALEVLFPGVQFLWKRPGATTEEATVLLTPSATEGTQNVYEVEIPLAEPGSWLARCEMTVRADGQVAEGASGNRMFELPALAATYVYLFRAEGSPLAPPFKIVGVGRTP
jgi:hypothetical protein